MANTPPSRGFERCRNHIHGGAAEFEMSCDIVVLISGNGSNLQALIEQSAAEGFRVAGVISNNPQAYGLRRAERADVPTKIIARGEFPDRAAFDRAMLAAVADFAPGLVVLAGFMRILGPDFVSARAGAIVNIHPSLLPKYPGMHTHRRALAAGDGEHGASIHFVTEDLDAGPIIARSRIAVNRDDSEQSLAARVHRLEHALYPRVVGWFAAGRLRWRADGAYFDGAKLSAKGIEVPPPAGV